MIAAACKVEFVGAARNVAVGHRCGQSDQCIGFKVSQGDPFIGLSSVWFFHDDFHLSGSSLRHRIGNTTEFARALTILEGPAQCGTHIVVPLFGMPVVDSTDVAVLVCEPTVARRTEQFRRVCPVCRGLGVNAVATREQVLYLVKKRIGTHRFDEDTVKWRRFR